MRSPAHYVAGMTGTLPELFQRWFAARGWQPRPHQLEVLDGRAGGRKRAADRADRRRQDAGRVSSQPGRAGRGAARGAAHALCQPAEGAGGRYRPQPDAAGRRRWRCRSRIDTRTGDTPATRRQKQREEPPNILLTTPESLALLLSLPDAAKMFAGLRAVVIDEVHALAGTKRGDQLALCLARLGTLAPGRAPHRPFRHRRAPQAAGAYVAAAPACASSR